MKVLKIPQIILCMIVVLLMGSILSAEGNPPLRHDSPFGITAVWPAPFPNQWNTDAELATLRSKYMPKLDSTQSCGIAWVKCQSVPFPLEDWYSSHFKFEAFDSLVVFLQEKDLYPMILLGPPPWGPWNSERALHTYIPLYYRVIVERYDGDGEGLMISCDSFPEVCDTCDTCNPYLFISEMENLTKPLKYWEVCNEPNLAGGTIYGHEWFLDDFRVFLRRVSEAVHNADSTAKVLAPAVSPALPDTWNDRHGNHYYFGADSIWRAVLSIMHDTIFDTIIDSIVTETSDSLSRCTVDTFFHIDTILPLPNAIDIITVHQYGDANSSSYSPAGKAAALDSCKMLVNSILDEFNQPYRPIWCTETGWMTVPQSVGHAVPYDSQAIYYVELLDSLVKRRDWLERTTFFALAHVEVVDGQLQHWGIMEIDSANNALIPKPAYYAYKDYIKGYYEPHLWARDSLATAYASGRKLYYRRGLLGLDSIVVVYQSRGKIVFAVYPYGICDTLNGDLHFDLGEPAMGYGKDGTLHLVFISSRDTIYYMKKVPGGGWSQPIIVAGAMAGDHLAHPSIAVDSDGYVHVVYLVSGVHDNRIEYRYFYSDSSMTSTISAQRWFPV